SPPAQLQPAPPFLAVASPAGGPGPRERHCSAPDLRAAALAAPPHPKYGRDPPALLSTATSTGAVLPAATLAALHLQLHDSPFHDPPLAQPNRTHGILPLARIPHESRRRWRPCRPHHLVLPQAAALPHRRPLTGSLEVSTDQRGQNNLVSKVQGL
ncbi:unnamed protein product, partial [Urochloa humidicola]